MAFFSCHITQPRNGKKAVIDSEERSDFPSRLLLMISTGEPQAKFRLPFWASKNERKEKYCLKCT